MNKKTMAILIVVLAGLLVWAAGSTGSGSLAQGGGEVGPQAVLTPLLQYQGRLTDPGTGEAVADGVYSISFRLYNVESGGSWLWMETEDVSVQGGLFSTVLGDTTALDHSLFNGQALWLGVKVGADAEATPRQQVLPVAYALGLVPGAVVEANSSSAVLQVNNTGSGDALSVGGDLNVSGSLTGGSHTHSGSDITGGTIAEGRIASVIARDSEIMPTVLANDGAGSSLDADLLDGYHASDIMSAAGSTSISGSTTSDSVTQMDSFRVYAPGPGTLTVIIMGSAYLDCDATSSSSQLCNNAWLGICDTSGTSATCGSSYRRYWFEDPDNATLQNEEHWITLGRTVSVNAAGARTFYLNGESHASGMYWSVDGYVLAIFTPDSMTVTNP